MSDTVLLALISLGSCIVTAITTIITTIIRGRASARHSAKQSIIGLMSEDYVSYSCMKKMPINKIRILEEYDDYKNTGGNSYIHEKIEEYLKWYNSVSEDICKKSGKK